MEEKEIKQNLKYMTLVQENIQISSSCSFHHHLIICLLVFGNEEKLVALLAYSSLRRVATSGIRNSSVATSSFT